jgi:hypothetical protein
VTIRRDHIDVVVHDDQSDGGSDTAKFSIPFTMNRRPIRPPEPVLMRRMGILSSLKAGRANLEQASVFMTAGKQAG